MDKTAERYFIQTRVKAKTYLEAVINLVDHVRDLGHTPIFVSSCKNVSLGEWEGTVEIKQVQSP